MKSRKFQIQLSPIQVKQAALARSGIAGQDYGMAKPTIAHRDRKAAAKRGYEKHRSAWF